MKHVGHILSDIWKWHQRVIGWHVIKIRINYKSNSIESRKSACLKTGSTRHVFLAFQLSSFSVLRDEPRFSIFRGSAGPQPLRLSRSLAMTEFSMKSFALLMWWRVFETCSQICYFTGRLYIQRHTSKIKVYTTKSSSGSRSEPLERRLSPQLIPKNTAEKKNKIKPPFNIFYEFLGIIFSFFWEDNCQYLYCNDLSTDYYITMISDEENCFLSWPVITI